MKQDLLRFLKYIQFKGECAAYQEQNPIRLDYDLAVKCKETLEKQQEEKVEQLKLVMPKVPIRSKRKCPKVTHKKDGTPSKLFVEWQKFLREQKLSPVTKEEVTYTSGYSEPNPNSHDQVKKWLYDLGWTPCTFKFLRDKETGDERQIEQVRADGELTQSVVNLKEKAPDIEVLEGLTVIQHRLGVFNGFISGAIRLDNKWYITATIGGLTNTLRFKHRKPLANIPGVDKPWGKEIRACLMADTRDCSICEGSGRATIFDNCSDCNGSGVVKEVFVGADMVSLEDTTKRHYMQPLDPDYVEEMSQEGYDPHLSLALFAGEITQDQYDNYSPDDKALYAIRKAYKATNYSAVYGVGVPTLARQMGITQRKAKGLLNAYWEKNHSVRKIADQQFVKKVGGYSWLKNPVSGFYYELRYDKDRFSTLNQGTGVYIFDSWLMRAKRLGYMGQAQFHDETAASVQDSSQTRDILFQAVDKLNQDLKLNVTIAIDMQVGQNYSETH
jgi:hypothetical protein